MEDNEQRIECFTFFRSYLEAAELLEDDQEAAAFIMAVCRYGLDGEEPDGLRGAPAALFRMARPSLEASRNKVFAGKKGGEAKAAKRKAGTALADGEQMPSKGVSDRRQERATRTKDTDLDEDIDLDEDTDSDHDKNMTKARSRRFTPPSANDVQEYCVDAGLSIDAERFVDFYESKNWMVGKTKMSNWHAAVRNWARTDHERSQEERRRQQGDADIFREWGDA